MELKREFLALTEIENKMRKQNILLLVIVAIAVAVAVFFQFYLSKNATEVKTEVSELVEKYNKSCPLNI